MRECVSPSPLPLHPPPPPRGKDAKAKVRSTSGSTASDQVIKFSFLDRAGVVTIATEQAAKVSCPNTPIPKQSSLAAGVRDFTPARPVIVDDSHVIAGPSTSGVLGGGLAKRGVGGRPISSPSPAKGWVKSAVAGRGTHGDSPIMCAAPIAAPACSYGPLSRQGSGERLPAPGNTPITVVVSQSAYLSVGVRRHPSRLTRRVPLFLFRRAEQTGRATVRPGRWDFHRLSLGRGWGRLTLGSGWAPGGSVPSVSVAGMMVPPSSSGPASIRPQWATSASALAPPVSSAIDPWSL